MLSRLRRNALAIAALVVAAFFLVTYAVSRRDIGRAYDRVATGSQIAQTRCGPIEYAVAGAGPPVLVVHGAGGGFDQGLELGDSLARSGYQVIAPSRFGYLRTAVPADASAAAQADAHACLLDALHVGRAVVVGVSAGGPSTLQFALRHPDRTAALVLLVPGVYAPRPEPMARMSRGTAFLLDTALRSDFIFWAAGKVAHQSFIRSILGTPPEVVARAPADEQARIERVLENILPVRPRRLGLVNDAAVMSSLPPREDQRADARHQRRRRPLRHVRCRPLHRRARAARPVHRVSDGWSHACRAHRGNSSRGHGLRQDHGQFLKLSLRFSPVTSKYDA
jgi:2-hydroxy-6-oxonona-2,4-dienedioate hydrolase